MNDTPYTIDLDTLPVRPVRCVRVLLDVVDRGQERVMVLDADTGNWVLPPALQGADRPAALAPDGTAVVLRRVWPHEPSLVWYALETDQRRELPRTRRVYDHKAAVSPDGRTVATNSTGPDPGDFDGVAAVDLVDVGGGQRRRLWQEPGGMVNESAVSFSPDGSMLAVTYNDADDEWATVVVDRTGSVVQRYPDAYLPLSANSAWTPTGHLLYTDDGNGTVVLADVRGGMRSELGEYRDPPLGMWNDDIVVCLADLTGLALNDAITGRRHPFLTISRPISIRGFDVAPRT
jgi:dipeptidyl aminopeptidase/acylaminoacyl peptidase